MFDSNIESSPFFSVVIPVYNRIDSLQTAIESVLLQTFCNFEVIVIDDGSCVDIAEKIKKLIISLEDPRFKLISYSQNKNGAFARNKGIENAKGKFIAFLDSDDQWDEQKLKIIYEAHLQYPDINFFYHQYVNVINNKPSAPFPFKGIEPSQSVAEYSFCANKGGGIQSSCITVHSVLAKQTMFNETLKGHQDWDFVLRISEKSGPLWFVSQPLTLRHISESYFGMVSRSLDYYYSLNFLNAYQKYFSIRAKAAYSCYILEGKRKSTFPSPQKTIYQLLGYLFYPAESYKTHRKYSRIKNRCKVLYKHCQRHNIRCIALLGFNKYTQVFLSSYGERFTKVVLLDKHKRNNTKYGQVVSLSTLSSRNPNNIDLFVAMTDHHFTSMQKDLRKTVFSSLPLIQF